MQQTLSEFRREAGYTQQLLAEKINCSPTTLSLIESGTNRPGPVIRRKLMDFFGITKHELNALLEASQPQPQESTT